jgi:hypothetical protein
MIQHTARGKRLQLISERSHLMSVPMTLPNDALCICPAASFELQKRPLGHLTKTVLKPLDAYFQTAAASWQYVMLRRQGWSMIESFHALAFGYSVEMWVLRLTYTGQEPCVKDIIRVAMMLDRGLTYAPLLGYRHRLRVRGLSHNKQLSRPAVLYARQKSGRRINASSALSTQELEIVRLIIVGKSRDSFKLAIPFICCVNALGIYN